MSDKLMTVEQIAEYLQVDEYTIYAWARKGKMPAFKVGRFWRFRTEDIDKWLEEARNKDYRESNCKRSHQSLSKEIDKRPKERF